MSILNCVFGHWQVAFMLICALDENCIVLELSSLLHDVGSCQRVYTQSPWKGWCRVASIATISCSHNTVDEPQLT